MKHAGWLAVFLWAFFIVVRDVPCRGEDAASGSDTASGKTVSENLIHNGGFEDGLAGWGYEEWKGLAVPGRIAAEQSREGSNHFVLTDPGQTTKRYIRCQSFVVDKTKNHVLSFSLAHENLVKGSVKVHILQYGPTVDKQTEVIGWVAPQRPGVHDLAPDLEGSGGWQDVSVTIPGAAIDPRTERIAVFFQHNHPSIGELRIDNARFAAVSE